MDPQSALGIQGPGAALEPVGLPVSALAWSRGRAEGKGGAGGSHGGDRAWCPAPSPLAPQSEMWDNLPPISNTGWSKPQSSWSPFSSPVIALESLSFVSFLSQTSPGFAFPSQAGEPQTAEQGAGGAGWRERLAMLNPWGLTNGLPRKWEKASVSKEKEGSTQRGREELLRLGQEV